MSILSGSDESTSVRPPGDSPKGPFIDVIVSSDDAIRNRSLDELCRNLSCGELQAAADSLDRFWRNADNLYERVRALFFLSAIHRYHLPPFYGRQHSGLIPFGSYQHLLERRFVESIDCSLAEQTKYGASDGLSSALAQAYHELGFQTLADQVRRSVRMVQGNQWMFRTGHPADHPLRLRPELMQQDGESPAFPVLRETTAVRMDFSHSGWSDIFFLGMDFPEGARVINASIDLGVHGRDSGPRPPIECYLRVIDKPVLRLVSVDLKSVADITTIAEVFDFARDYLGLVKAAVIAAGIVPPGMEGCGLGIEPLLRRLIRPGLGLEIASKVNDIPKGSRLAVSTNLLGSLISVCMRATGQVTTLDGGLTEADRRVIAARAILGEWLGGSGGGWQDSGGVWPGIKLIEGALAEQDDPEFGVSRGRLLPRHSVFSEAEVSLETRQRLQDSLVLVHGGMAQNVGPILEMVTEKYLLRSPNEWKARQQAMGILAAITDSLKSGDIASIGRATHQNFAEPLQSIIPWCSNLFTETLIEAATAKYGDLFWGFWMLGGMSGGGMGFIFDPSVKADAQPWLQQTLTATKAEMEASLPFAMEPVVYDFAINDRGSWAELQPGDGAPMPDEYYYLLVPEWLKKPASQLSLLTRFELEWLGQSFKSGQTSRVPKLMESVLPSLTATDEPCDSLEHHLDRLGFDHEYHEQVRSELQCGRLGLSQNRLPLTTDIVDVLPTDVVDVRWEADAEAESKGRQALAEGKVAVVSLAAGIGTRWTEGAGVVKALHPFCRLSGRHRSFLEVHLAKSRLVGEQFGHFFPHVITTGYLTDRPIRSRLDQVANYGYAGQVVVSPGKYVGLRTVPMVRDLQFAWEEMPQQMLYERQERMRTSLRAALIGWAKQAGQGSDYRDNAVMQCLHPVGHWFEIPNMLRNGSLRQLLQTSPQLQYLMLHNVDTLGVNLDARILGQHIRGGTCLTFEVISRRLEDRGGGLARVNGLPRLLEGLAMPREQDEFRLSYYNSMTTWIDIDQLLLLFGLRRDDLGNQTAVDKGVRALAARMPTYITIKDVKKRWGHGQEDVFPVSQFEKLWGDMSGLPDVSCQFVVVPLPRGRQLKEQSQLDGWLRDGSADYVNRLCGWV